VTAIGEIGLSGELRKVRDLPQRLAEAARLGFRVALAPTEPGRAAARSPESWTVDGMRVLDVPDVRSALRLLQLLGPGQAGQAGPRAVPDV
jgi:DNA repair protein RadA/Sms